MPRIPSIKSVMTRSPLAVDIDERVVVAQDLMIDHEVRHLPVLEEKKLVGVLSDRDIATLENDADSEELAQHLRVRDVCTLDCYAVPPDEPLDVVLDEMGKRRIGSVVICDAGDVLGVFTMTDACRVFAEYLRGHAAGG